MLALKNTLISKAKINATIILIAYAICCAFVCEHCDSNRIIEFKIKNKSQFQNRILSKIKQNFGKNFLFFINLIYYPY